MLLLGDAVINSGDVRDTCTQPVSSFKLLHSMAVDLKLTDEWECRIGVGVRLMPCRMKRLLNIGVKAGDHTYHMLNGAVKF